MERTPITREGYDRLRQEVEHLERVERPSVVKAIAEARAHGDLSENAEYSAAKERQSLIEGKIQDLRYKLSTSEIIDFHDLTCDRITFGNVVVLTDLESGQSAQYHLVGPHESDASNGRISVTAPLGKALIGKEVGDEVKVNAPGGIREFEVVDILIPR
ncbi:MAG: transcription elongation factor GreA [Pseudomonadota bacterium]